TTLPGAQTAAGGAARLCHRRRLCVCTWARDASDPQPSGIAYARTIYLRGSGPAALALSGRGGRRIDAREDHRTPGDVRDVQVTLRLAKCLSRRSGAVGARPPRRRGASPPGGPSPQRRGVQAERVNFLYAAIRRLTTGLRRYYK